MTEPTSGRLRVPGATLHYEVRGRGPLLLLIPGGTGGAASFDGVADALAADHTVATYDPRGIARSPLDDPGAEQRVAEHAGDALRLLDLLSPDKPARVFGASSGGIVSLHLLATHPERLARVVVHEPPVVEILPDAAGHRATVARVVDTFRTHGLMPAMAEFAAYLGQGGTGGGTQAREQARGQERIGLPPQAAARAETTIAGLPYFIERVVPSFMAYVPDLDRLRAMADRLVVGCGAESGGEVPHRAAAYLAERLGVAVLRFPGGHVGLTTHPAEFGELLRKALRA
jgi:Predicted hydrolases or acyltransferases (alpha/beta hydrolase superfamily)